MRPDDVIAIYFPNYHRYPHNDAWYGEGWTEWTLVRNAPPRFNGHQQPKVPSWGYFDESDPACAEREIDLAADHGITGFLVDWYWYSGVQLMQEQLERGFLKAANRQRLKFALMWANHPWMNFFPVDQGKTAAQMNCWLPMRHNITDMEQVANYCIEHYFREPNYWRVDGKLYFSFFSFAALEKELGGVAGISQALKLFDTLVRKAGLPGMHFNVNIANIDVTQLCWSVDVISLASKAGFHSVFGYNVARSQRYAETQLACPFVDYGEIMESHEVLWQECSGRELPFFPTVTMGYDCTPRWDPAVKLPLTTLDYPYEPIVVNNTPERYAQLCHKAKSYLERTNGGPSTVFLNAWNEWPEGNYLLPESRYGTAYLEAVRDTFGKEI